MESHQRLRGLVCGVAIALIVLVSAALYFVHPIAARGFLGGGLVGVLGIWLLARRLEKLAATPPDKIQFQAIRDSFLRMIIYALVLGWAYSLDPDSFHGLIAAAVGIFSVRLVLVVVAFSGADLRLDKEK